MGDAEICTRKRKLSTESIIQVSDDEECLEISSESIDLEIIESNSKIQRLEQQSSSQNSDCNLELVSFSSDNGIIEVEDVDSKQKLLLLEDEIKRLKQENEELKSETCLCKKVQADEKAIALITFANSNNYVLYKDKLLKEFSKSLDFDVNEDESKFSITLSKECDIQADEWVIIDERELAGFNVKPSKKKKKKSKTKSNELFTLDTTPSIAKRDLQYESKFTVLSNPNEKKGPESSIKAQACFNCNEDHNLRDCPKPKNYMKINMARQKLKSQQSKSVRYHLEDDQKFSHLKPGMISNNLQEALGLRHYQLPEYIYKMRILGYPPGWIEEHYETPSSELVLFDFEGNSASVQKNQVQEVNSDTLIDYSGFNVPMQKGVKDEYLLYRCPQYSRSNSKENIIQFVQNNRKQLKDNLETCDMDLDNSFSDKNTSSVEQKERKINEDICSSPTLVELESEKEQLLAKLSEDTVLSMEDKLDDTLFKTIDATGVVDEEFIETVGDVGEQTTVTTIDDDEEMPTEVVDDDSQNQSINCNDVSTIIVKASSFGTPILKSSTPYSKLPEPEKFSKDVSPVINFENLPNSTGKYKQMITVLQKVRKIRDLNEQKS